MPTPLFLSQVVGFEIFGCTVSFEKVLYILKMRLQNAFAASKRLKICHPLLFRIPPPNFRGCFVLVYPEDVFSTNQLAGIFPH